MHRSLCLAKTFWADAVAALGDGTSALEPSLRALARRDFIGLQDGSRFEGQEQYAFKHALICDVAYGQLRRGARAAKHRLAAEWLETHAPGEDAAELIAHHRWSAFELGGGDPADVRQTLDSLARAGERARSLYANADAASHFRRALALAVRDGADVGADRRAALEEALGDVLVLGDPDAARDAFERALVLIPPASRLRRGRLHRKRGASYPAQQGGADDARAAFAEAEAAFGAAGETENPAWWEERIELEFGRLQLVYLTGGDLSAAVERAQPLVARHGTPLQRERLLYHLAMAQLRRDRFAVEPATIDRVRHGLATVEASGDLPAICSWRFTLGFVLVFANRLDEAEERLSSSLELASAIGDTTRRIRSLTYLALAHRLRGDAERTQERAQTALVAAGDAGISPYVATAHAHLGWAAYRQGRRAQAREHVDRAWAIWPVGPQVSPFQWMVLWPRLGLAEAGSRHNEAVDCARRLLAPQSQPPPVPLLDRLTRAVAATDRGDPVSARALLADAVALAPAHGLL